MHFFFFWGGGGGGLLRNSATKVVLLTPGVLSDVFIARALVTGLLNFPDCNMVPGPRGLCDILHLPLYIFPYMFSLVYLKRVMFRKICGGFFQGPSEVPILVDTRFEFPDAAFWHRLLSGSLFPPSQLGGHTLDDVQAGFRV